MQNVIKPDTRNISTNADSSTMHACIPTACKDVLRIDFLLQIVAEPFSNCAKEGPI